MAGTRANLNGRLSDYRTLLGQRRANAIAARAKEYAATLSGRDERWLQAARDVLDDPYQSLNAKGAEETLKLDQAKALAARGGVSEETSSQLDALERQMRTYRLHTDVWVERHAERAARVEAISAEQERRKSGRNPDGSFRSPAGGGDSAEAYRHPLGQRSFPGSADASSSISPKSGRSGARAEIWDRAYHLDVQADQLEQTEYRPGLARALRARATLLREKQRQMRAEVDRSQPAQGQAEDRRLEQRVEAEPELGIDPGF